MLPVVTVRPKKEQL